MLICKNTGKNLKKTFKTIQKR